MLSRTAEYALRAVLWVAAHADRPRTAQQIAEGTGVPAGYLSKVLQQLARTGLLRAQPGPHGGFALARPAEELTVLAVTDAVDPIRRIQECPAQDEEHSPGLCPLHSRLDAAIALVRDEFAACTIATLLHESAAREAGGAPGAACNLSRNTDHGQPGVARDPSPRRDTSGARAADESSHSSAPAPGASPERSPS